MKTIVVGDTHFGVRNASPVYMAHAKRWLEECFWPTVDRTGATHLVHLGDVFDHSQRKSLNITVLEFFHENFIRPAMERDLHMALIVGNHDMHLRDEIVPNLPREALRYNETITIVQHPTMWNDILLIPWPTESNAKAIQRALKTSEAKYVMGHLAVAGVRTSKTHVNEEGFSIKAFKRFESVLSGHFHTRVALGNVRYISCPLDHYWLSEKNWQGFVVWEDGQIIEEIETPWRVHVALRPDDPIPDIKASFVRLICKEKPGEDQIAAIRAKEPADVRIELVAAGDLPEVEPEVAHLPTRQLIEEYLDALKDLGVDKDKLRTLMMNLFEDANADRFS